MRYAVIDLPKLGAALPGEDASAAIEAATMPTMSRLLNVAPDMLVALKAIEPMYYRAHRAYQFGATSYTYEALTALTSARVQLERVIEKASGRGWHV